MLQATTCQGWKSLRLATAQAELVLPLEVGPRVVHCGLLGQPNLFATQPSDQGGHGEPDWKIRGGHRLWHSPEHPVRTYVPDNSPVSAEPCADGRGVTLRQPSEAGTGMAKTLTVVALDDTTFRLTHHLHYEGLWPVTCAAWALTVLAHGGAAAIPLQPKGAHPRDLLPDYHLVPWTYTDFSLPCWKFHREFLAIDVSRADRPQKIGLSNYPGWSAYWQPAGTFVKYSPVRVGAPHPDFGCAFETFCCDWMIELETLSPLVTLEPGQTITHIEYWGLFRDLPKPDTDEAFATGLRPAVDQWLARLPV